MNLRDFYTTYKDILQESVKNNVETQSTEKLSQDSNGILVSEKINTDSSTINRRLCFLLFTFFGQADKYAWEHYVEYDENDNPITEEDPEPWDGKIHTWNINSGYFENMPKYISTLREKMPTDGLNIKAPSDSRYDLCLSNLYYDPKYPLRYYIGGTWGCTTHLRQCSWNTIFKDTEKAHCIPPEKDKCIPDQLALTYCENIPYQYQEWFYLCVLNLIINKLNSSFHFKADYYFDKPDPTRRTRMIEWAIKHFPNKEICTWAKYTLL